MSSKQKHGLTLIPTSPVSHITPVEIRTGLVNPEGEAQSFQLDLYLDTVEEQTRLFSTEMLVDSKRTATVRFNWLPGVENIGYHKIVARVISGETSVELVRPLLVVESSSRSLDFIAGAFGGFYHWSETEGRLWNSELKHFTDHNWRELVRAQYELGMNIIVPQETFRNQDYVGQHTLEESGYNGLACYDSALFPGRLDIATADPLKVILEEAEELGMQVFVPVGMYAWFDFSKGSLEWHKQVATELWNRYGNHNSFYGWYVSEEIAGDLGTNDARREELVHFFKEFTAHCREMAPEKPVMLATNCHFVRTGLDYYPRLLENLDIICPFGFQRMPEDDLTADEAAELLQTLCDAAGAHLWLDMEAFNFHPDTALYPRPIAELVEELHSRKHFEKIICYQFPGMFNAEWATVQPGGPDTVVLYNDYRDFVMNTLPCILPTPAPQPALADSALTSAELAK